MAYENFPSAEDLPKPDSAPSQKNWRNPLTAVLVIALLATWGYIIWDKNRTKEIIQQKDTVITATNSLKDELQKELEEATSLYDRIKTSSANMVHSKDSVITKRDREINEKKNRIGQLLAKLNATKEELAEAKTLIASLNGDIESYKTKIESLEGEKIVLIQEKDNVTRQRDKVSRDLDSAQAVLKQKEDVIDIGSTLHAINFSIVGVNEKHNGNEKETTTAKRVDKLHISFDIEENRIAQSGVKNIYICITAPDGTPISVPAFGSGTFTLRDGKEKVYTQKLNVQYIQGQRQTLSFDWKQNASYLIGDYKIEVYHNGFKIGEATRTLKKGGLFG